MALVAQETVVVSISTSIISIILLALGFKPACESKTKTRHHYYSNHHSGVTILTRITPHGGLKFGAHFLPQHERCEIF
jgi:hypothetical protein